MVTEVVHALARVSLRDRPLTEVLAEVSALARRVVPAADATSVTLLRGDKAFTAANSGQQALEADGLQYERGYGPCMDAGRTGLLMHVVDMAAESRWPDYAAAVQDSGIRSSVSAPLPYQGATIGALNVYAGEPDAFSAEDIAACEEVADYIAVAVNNADAHSEAVQLAVDMRRAMESRAVIDMAKGVLIARHRCSPDEAFAILSRTSQNHNRKLRELAEALVASEHAPISARPASNS